MNFLVHPMSKLTSNSCRFRLDYYTSFLILLALVNLTSKLIARLRIFDIV
jgi:hypothetical protein